MVKHSSGGRMASAALVTVVPVPFVAVVSAVCGFTRFALSALLGLAPTLGFDAVQVPLALLTRAHDDPRTCPDLTPER